jgi:hypothetical protein
MNNIGFTRNLIKGKIAEIVFERMLREAGIFTIMHFGYEYILPELANGSTFDKESETMKAIRRAPDFAIINNETKKVHLIEVKYRRTKRNFDILKIAQQMGEAWNPSFIFLATKKGFYFDSIEDVIKNKGDISELKHKNIPPELQKKYLKLLDEMEN